MEKNDSFGIAIILLIIGIALFGGVKNSDNIESGSKTTTTQDAEREKANIEKSIRSTQKEVNELRDNIKSEEDKKNRSVYYDLVNLSSVTRSTDPTREYVTIRVSNKATTTIPVTGWTIKSSVTGFSVAIPKASYLFFTGMMNVEENIVLSSGEVLYLNTGISPNGASFRVNKCSGYLSQFQTFVPYLANRCPYPDSEDLSSIPFNASNEACLDYIDRMPRCKIQTTDIPTNWGSECRDFIYNKVNYPSCINTHKNDPDFYQKEWRVYLKRGSSIWRKSRESLTLYDNQGKVVDTLSY